MSKDNRGFDGWANTYDEDIRKASGTDDWMFGSYDRVLDRVVDYCELDSNEYSTVLDIGVGTGNLAGRFFERGLQVTGIDPSGEMRGICAKKFPQIRIMEGDFLNILLPPGSADIIVSAYAFHHLTPEQKEESIPLMRGVLRPQGRIVIADLMFRNESEKQKIKQALLESGNNETVEEIEDEYFGHFDDLENAFGKEGFRFQGGQLTESIWIFRALL